MLTRADTDRRPRRLADLLPGLLCTAVEDITGHPCRRLDCDGIHSATGVDPWAPAPVAAADLHLPVVRGATTTDPEEADMPETDNPAIARLRELATELRGAPQVDGRGPRRRHVADAMYADALDGVLAELDEARDVVEHRGAYIAELLTEVGELRQELESRAPRVWLTDGEEIPQDVRVVDQDGEIHWPGEDDEPGTTSGMFGFGPLVEVALPDRRAFWAAVAAEEARRALSADLPPAEAGSGNGAGETRTAASGAPGASQGPSEGEGSER